MTDTNVIALPGVLMPEDGPFRRHVRPPGRRTPLYEDRYDRRTLIYDAVRMPLDGVCLTTPRLLNLWPVLRDGLQRDGAALSRHLMRRRTFLRFEQIMLRGAAQGLTLDLGQSPQPLPLRDSGAPLFADLRVVMAVNKDNALDWIADWAAFHVIRHGAEGVLVFDNGSTAYGPHDIAARLSTVPGLRRAVILSAPFPYGPADKGGRFDVPPRFFQTAMFNLARRDLVARARSVLSVDIDELVGGPDGASVFEAAERHPLGMLTLPGHWAFPAPDAQGPQPQRVHLWGADPSQPCHPKWCIAPGGLMGYVAWNVHKPGGPLPPVLTTRHGFRLYHCRATSTGWKAGRFTPPEKLRKDPDIEALFADTFGS